MRKISIAFFCVVILIDAGLLAGCGTDFDPSYEVHGLRVLAVGGEPPTVLRDSQTEISVLAVTPNDYPVSLSFELCEYTLGSDDLRQCPPNTVLAEGEG